MNDGKPEMALSNIINEPRREITESAVGIAVVAAVIGSYGYSTYLLAALAAASSRDKTIGDFIGAALFGPHSGATWWR